jgi:hypothetical protein
MDTLDLECTHLTSPDYKNFVLSMYDPEDAALVPVTFT